MWQESGKGSSWHLTPSKEAGFEPWETFTQALENPTESLRIDQKFRALTPWPGLWTKVTIANEEKRVKILFDDYNPIYQCFYVRAHIVYTPSSETISS